MKIDAKGEAKFILRVGMQPGNNDRVVASLMDEKMYEGVQVTNPTGPRFLGTKSLQNAGAPASPLLTVWRRRWVEKDGIVAI